MNTSATVATQVKHKLSLPVAIFGGLSVAGITFLYITYRASRLVMVDDGGGANKFFLTNLSYIIFELVVWTIAAVAALRLKAYARSVIESPDGRALDFMANGLLYLVPYSIFISIGTNFKILFMNTSYYQLVTVLCNHIPVLVVLAASFYVYVGSERLIQLLPARPTHLARAKKIAISIFIPVVLGFAWYFYSVSQTIIDDDGLPHYGLSASTMLLTYVLPYIVAWLFGCLACVNIAHYAHRVKGVIYKPLFHGLYKGLVTVFICTLIVQILLATNISLKEASPALLLVFGVIGLLIAGYLQIYRGVNQLYRLERW